MLSIKKTLQKILQNLKQPIKVQVVTRVVTVAQMDVANLGDITAPNVSGYTFLYWGAFSTVGWISSLYPEYTNNATTKVFQGAQPRYKPSSDGTLKALAIYVRNDLA